MRQMSIPRVAAEHFFLWIGGVGSPESTPDIHIPSYVMDWLERGKGIEAVVGKYAIFLKAMTIVIQEAYRDPSMLDFVYEEDGVEKRLRRYPRCGHYLMDEHDDMWGDEDYFDAIAFDYHYGLGDAGYARRRTD